MGIKEFHRYMVINKNKIIRPILSMVRPINLKTFDAVILVVF